MDKLTQQEMEFVIQAIANTQIQAKDSAFAQGVLEKLGADYQSMLKASEKNNKKQADNSTSKSASA
jgi:hypothetical protein|tara:strand:+ start:11499 stop:11696 length:198 start_codon:yes stop_codon:yes gene_type:complete